MAVNETHPWTSLEELETLLLTNITEVWVKFRATGILPCDMQYFIDGDVATVHRKAQPIIFKCARGADFCITTCWSVYRRDSWQTFKLYLNTAEYVIVCPIPADFRP